MKFLKAGLPDFCAFNYVRVVSGRVMDLFQSFDIGVTRFHEVPILDLDGHTPLAARWFILYVVSKKSCFVPELTSQGRATGQPETGYTATNLPRNDLFVRASAAAGSDMWTDPVLFGALFFSDRMKRAIEKARFRKSITFVQCKVVDG